MAAVEIAGGGRSQLEHSAQLRRAVIASTICTRIEWYDFLLYGQVTGLVFAKLYSGIRSLDRRAASRRRLCRGLFRAPNRCGNLWALRRSHWRQGGADRDLAVDRPCDLYGTTVPGSSRDFLLIALLTASFISFFTIPISGHLSDRIGRKRMYLFGAAEPDLRVCLFCAP
jgi:MFS family permease